MSRCTVKCMSAFILPLTHWNTGRYGKTQA
nr:MAG TPA: hypothetical protein [Caudoviricetes sp.]